MSRVAALAQGRSPRESKEDRQVTGAACWVGRLYDQIAGWRKAAWSWADVASLLNDAAVPLKNAKWDGAVARKEFWREKKRRAKRIVETSERREGGIAAIAVGQPRSGEKNDPLGADRRGATEIPAAAGGNKGGAQQPRRGITLRPPGMPQTGRLPSRAEQLLKEEGDR